MRGNIQEVRPKEILCDNILAVFSKLSFGKVMASRIVGGRARLMQLIAEGKIEADKPNADAANGKWTCNAAQVLEHCRLERPTGRSQTN